MDGKNELERRIISGILKLINGANEEEVEIETEKIVEKKAPVLNRKKVVVGMTGGIDSTVAAFLLKKQGYDCIGVGIILIDEQRMKESIGEPEEEDGYFAKKAHIQKQTLEEKASFLKGHCSVKNLDQVAAICERLGIPFYAVNAVSEYQDIITDRLIGSSLVGEYFPTCVYSNNLKLSILNDKAKKLGASYIATGHYAKIFKRQGSSAIDIHSSNDTENDQSYMFSMTDQENLQNLILPLADTRRQEVKRIIERFNFPSKILRDSSKMCFYGEGDISFYIDSVTPEGLKFNGSVVNKETKIQVAEHTGLHKFRPAQKAIESRGINIFGMNIDPTLVVHEITPKGKIFVVPEERNFFMGCGISDMKISGDLDISRPISCYFQNSVNGKRVHGTIFFKSNSNATILFDDKFYNLGKGQILSFYNKPDVGAKLLGAGKINYLQELTLINRIEQYDEKISEDEELGAEERNMREAKKNTIFTF